MGLAARLRQFVRGAEDGYGAGAWDGGGQADAPAVAGLPCARGIVLVRPDRYVDAGKITDYLVEGYAVLLDVERVTPEASRRIVDFLSGAAYGRDGRFLAVSRKAYLLAPGSVEILDQTGLLGSGGGDWDYDNAFGI